VVIARSNCPNHAIILGIVSSQPHQLLAWIESVLPKADEVLHSGRLAAYLSPPMMIEAMDVLAPRLPKADVILGLGLDDAALIFELSMRLNLPFVSAKFLDVVPSDDTDSSGFLQDPNLLQVQCKQETLAIAKSAVSVGSRVLIFRDLLSSGVTTLALLDLVTQANATPVGVATLIEKGYLGARSRLGVHNLEVFAGVSLARQHEAIILEQRSGQK
jgi:adenine/guanine phosphoribosyltransferase-like PRPP-binding protein